MTGVELIAQERHRQISDEGWTTEHDRQHFDGSLAIAGALIAAEIDRLIALKAALDADSVPAGSGKDDAPRKAVEES